MPSLRHESIIALFRENPGLVVTLLREIFALELPEGPVRVEEGKLPSLTPATYEADLVLRLGESWSLVLEVQLRRDRTKLLRWPVYAANLRARTGLPVLLLVICPAPEVAAWAAQPIEMGQPGWTFRALVLGPERIPVVTSPAQAALAPELLVLSAMAHGAGPQGLAIATAALESWNTLDIGRSEFYTIAGSG